MYWKNISIELGGAGTFVGGIERLELPAKKIKDLVKNHPEIVYSLDWVDEIINPIDALSVVNDEDILQLYIVEDKRPDSRLTIEGIKTKDENIFWYFNKFRPLTEKNDEYYYIYFD